MSKTMAPPRGCHGGGYRHEAFFYDGLEQFLAGTVPFVRDAVAAEEPVLAVLGSGNGDALREALDGAAGSVLFADMEDVGTNPARIIPAWRSFLDEHGADGLPARGIGEPAWPGRSTAELDECERHEALLNVAFGDPSFWLLCPYDAGALPDDVLAGARRTHPYVRDARGGAASERYAGPAALSAPDDRALPEAPADAQVLEVDIATLAHLRAAVERHATEAGVTFDRAADLVLSVHELATNSLRHGGGRATLRMWRENGSVVCEVRDAGRIDDPLVGRVEPSPAGEGGRGLWMANQLCELVQIRSVPEGTAVRAHLHIA
jgi:anti-sigma regulatory factor (Ser/Thr protein kinase)